MRRALLAVLASIATLPAQVDPLDSATAMRATIERFRTDRGLLERRYRLPMSEAWVEQSQRFLDGWVARLDAIDFDALDRAARIDWILLRQLVRHELQKLARTAADDREVATLLPYLSDVVALEAARRAGEPFDPAVVADALDALARRVDAKIDAPRTDPDSVSASAATTPPTTASVSAAVDASASTSPTAPKPDARLARRAAARIADARRVLGDWHEFHDGYDPLFSWWTTQPFKALDAALEKREKALRPAEEGDVFHGDPIGADALREELADAFIPYTPDELIAIAEREFAWCDQEMLRASREMGCGDDWKQALDRTKRDHVAPGAQPALVRELAREAIDFVESRGLVTVPDACKESWRMTMLSPKQQKTSPYFLGGETIQIGFPTGDMEHGDKVMSLRSGNRHFARATVHHELIPGHCLQAFMTARHRPYRSLFSTPFWTEGWALYWECLLWDLDFAQSAEDRVGMLFWRMHRCARIVFSLRYHLGTMSEQEAIDYLVERVGHERSHATAEVRRSFASSYGPLYQAGYMLGALQLRALRREVVDGGKLGERAFHDAVLQENSIPIELVRASLTGQHLTREFATQWRFYDAAAATR